MLDEENGFYYKGEEKIDLTPLELKLLSFFIERKEKIIPYQNIVLYIYGQYNEKTMRSARQVIHKINKKMKGELIRFSKNAIGYRLVYLGK